MTGPITFAAPTSEDLLTGEGLAGIEVELPAGVEAGTAAGDEMLERVQVSLGVSDVSDAFHRMRIPLEPSAYFCLPEVTAEEMRLTGAGRGPFLETSGLRNTVSCAKPGGDPAAMRLSK